MSDRCPWNFHPALTERRLALAARLLVRGRADAIARAEPGMGDDSWSVGCRAYSFSRYQVRRAAESGRHPWLKVLDDTQHFVFLIDGVPIRFYRGPAEEPNARTLIQQEVEAQQISLAFGGDVDTDGLLFRLAIETDAAGEVSRVVFLALRGDQIECFWPVPLDVGAEVLRMPGKRRGRDAPDGTGQLAFPIAAA